MYIRQGEIKVHSTDVTYYRITNDINGNPRFVIHFLAVTADYNEAVNIAKTVGGKKYRGKWFGGGIVLCTYNLRQTLEQIIKE